MRSSSATIDSFFQSLKFLSKDEVAVRNNFIRFFGCDYQILLNIIKELIDRPISLKLSYSRVENDVQAKKSIPLIGVVFFSILLCTFQYRTKNFTTDILYRLVSIYMLNAVCREERVDILITCDELLLKSFLLIHFLRTSSI